MSSVKSEQISTKPSQQTDDSVSVTNISPYAVDAGLPLVKPWFYETYNTQLKIQQQTPV